MQVHRLALFLTTLFKTHLGIVEQEALAPALIQGMQVLSLLAFLVQKYKY